MKTENPVESIQKMELFNSAELRLGSMHCIYEFQLIEIKQGSICGLVKEDSVLLGHISTGDVVPINYYTPDRSIPGYSAETRIKEITKENSGRFSGHCLVSLEWI